MTIKKRVLIVALVFLIFSHPQMAISGPARVMTHKVEKHPANWNSKMQGLYISLAELLTDTTTDRRFNDPKYKKQIQKNADYLSKVAHELSQQKLDLPNTDPTLQIVSGLLAREAKDAAQFLREGNRAFARSILRTIPSYCVACHTRNTSGSQFKELALDPTHNAMTGLEKGEFFAATRQFDRALTEFDQQVKNEKQAQEDHWSWSRSIHEALSIIVRVKKDPKAAEEIVKVVQNTKSAPHYLREEAKTWEKSIKEWKSEINKTFDDENELMAEAKRLTQKARDMQKFVTDRSADIYYLRASAVLHDLLQIAKTEQNIGDALLMLGMSYEVLNPLKNSNMHQIYYESCILKTPHTITSELCYRRYEENIILGFAGSSGISVPEGLKKRLHQLETLSRPLDSVQKPK